MHHVLGEQRRGVRADAEERRMAERHDARVAEDRSSETANSARIAISFNSAACRGNTSSASTATTQITVS